MTHETWDVLEAVTLAAVLGKAIAVSQHKGDLDQTGDADSHQSPAKHLVGRGTDHELLRMSTHAPTSNENHKSRNKVTLRATIAVLAEPNASKTGSPPDDTHGGVLPVILDPGGAPAVLGKGIDHTPRSNDSTVEELLRATRPLDPDLTNDQDESKDNTIGNKGASHDEVGSTLTDVLALAEAERGDASKDQLGPDKNGKSLANNTVAKLHNAANLAIDALFQMQPQVYSHDDLAEQHEHERRSKFRVDVGVQEFATTVHVTESVAQ